MRTFLLALVVALSAIGISHSSHAACPTPNPNNSAPPFVDNCPVPAAALNKAVALTVSVTGYGAVGNGSTDDSTAFQNAVNALCTAGGGILGVPTPKVSYLAHDIKITCPVLIQGSGRTAATIDYHTASSFGIEYQVTGFPSFKSGSHVIGGGIENIMLKDGSSSATGVIVEGFQDWYMHHVTFQQPYNGVYSFGNEKLDFKDVTMNGTRHANYNFYGDLTGETASGGACTTGNADCSTRTDFVVMHDIEDVDNTNTNTGLTIQGFVATVMGDHFSFEGPATGLSVSCQSGLDPNMSQCPHFIFLHDFQTEFFSTIGITATDFLDMRLDQPYVYGNNSNTNDATFGSTNYSASTVPPGKLMVSHGLFFVATGDCITVSGALIDGEIDHNWINGCNSANGGTGGIYINPTTDVSQLTIDNNTFCTLSSFGGAHVPAYAVKINSGGTDAGTKVVENYFYGCGNPPVVINGGGFANMVRNNLGPNTNPAISSCGTGSPSVSGKDDSMLITVGTGSPSSCVVNFANTWATAPICAYAAAPGASGVTSLSTSTTTVTLGGSSETGQYSVVCQSPY